MSDSGFPPSTPPIGSKSFPPSRNEQAVKIERAQGEIRHVLKPTRIEGQVVRHNRDGTLHVQTDKGTLDIRVQGRNQPAEGQFIEIDIPAGSPPRKATIRPVPEKAQKSSTDAPGAQEGDRPPKAETRRETPKQDGRNTVEGERGQETRPEEPTTPRLSENVSRELSQRPEETAPPRRIPVQIDDIVRLIPLTREQQAAIILPEIVRAETAVSNVVSDNARELLSVLKPEAVQQIVQTTAPQIAPTANPDVSQAQAQPQAPEVPAVSPPVITTTETTPQATQSIANPLPDVLSLVLLPPVITGETPVTPAVTPQTAPVINNEQPVPIKILLSRGFPVPVQPASTPEIPKQVVNFNGLVIPDTTKTIQTPLQQILDTVTLPKPETLTLQPVVLPEAAFTPITSPETTETGETAIKPKLRNTLLTVTKELAPVEPLKIQTKATNFDIQIKAIHSPGLQLVTSDGIPSAIEIATQPNVYFSPTPEANEKSAVIKADPGMIKNSEGRAETQTARIVGTIENKLPVLSLIPNSTNQPILFAVQVAAANLLPDTWIEIIPQAGIPSVSGQMTAIPQQAPGMPTPPLQLFSSFEWPAFEMLQQTIAQISPDVAQAMARMTPSPNAPTRLSAAAMFFIAAIRAGDLSGWLGQKTMDILRQTGKTQSLERLGRDFMGLQRTSSDPVSQDWRALTLPLAWQDEIHKMHLYYRHDKPDEDKEEGKLGTRFIMDLNLSRMGAVQLDGLHRGQRLDLIIRTENRLSSAMQQQMRHTYINAIEQANVKGELSFQAQREKFITVEMPKDEMTISI